MKREMIRISKSSKFAIQEMEVDKDHLHFLIDSTPGVSALQIVKKLKQESTIALWRYHAQILQRHFWEEKTFWTDGYFVSTIGQASEEMVRQYIKEQG